MTYKPKSVNYNGKIYPYVKLLGRGGTSSVDLYGNESLGYVALKTSFCQDPAGPSKYAQELASLDQISKSGACSPASVHWRRAQEEGRVLPLQLIRAPLSWKFENGCYYTLLEYYPDSLAEWLQKTPERTAEQVQGIFLQVVTILNCLREQKLYYNDLKPTNLVVKSSPGDPVPRVVIGDLGGIDEEGSAHITVTPSRLPVTLLQNLQWQKIDVLTGFLLGELILQLLMQPSSAGSVHPMNDFMRCLRDAVSSDSCTDKHILPALKDSLAINLSLNDPRIMDLSALDLNLLGYRGWFISADDALGLKSRAW